MNDIDTVYRSADAGEDAGAGAPAAAVTDTHVTPGTDTSVTPEGTEGTGGTDSGSLLTPTDSDAAPAADDATDGEKARGEKTDTPPDTYADFTMPEGVTVDSALLTEAAPVFKDLGLTQDQAQKLVDFQAKQVQASSANQVEAFNQMMSDWQEQSRNDKEFGGDKFDESISVARSAVDKFGTPELSKLLEEHGVGNHPEVIRFMVKVGTLTKEDVPGGSTAATSPAQDRLQLLYPNDRQG